MKKLFAILLTVIMVCSLSVPGWAAEATTEVTEFTWDEVKDAAPEVEPDARFVQIANWNLCMWLPRAFTEQELTEEDIEWGAVSFLTTEDGEATIEIETEDNVEGDGLDVWRDAFVNIGYEDAEIVVINGIQALMYSDEANDLLNVFFPLIDSGKMLHFTFWPYTDEDFQSVIYMMVSSLQEME